MCVCVCVCVCVCEGGLDDASRKRPAPYPLPCTHTPMVIRLGPRTAENQRRLEKHTLEQWTFAAFKFWPGHSRLLGPLRCQPAQPCATTPSQHWLILGCIVKPILVSVWTAEFYGDSDSRSNCVSPSGRMQMIAQFSLSD